MSFQCVCVILVLCIIYFRSLQHQYNLTTDKYEKWSIWCCRDSNSRPLGREPPPITTIPGLPPDRNSFKVVISFSFHDGTKWNNFSPWNRTWPSWVTFRAWGRSWGRSVCEGRSVRRRRRGSGRQASRSSSLSCSSSQFRSEKFGWISFEIMVISLFCKLWLWINFNLSARQINSKLKVLRRPKQIHQVGSKLKVIKWV